MINLKKILFLFMLFIHVSILYADNGSPAIDVRIEKSETNIFFEELDKIIVEEEISYIAYNQDGLDKLNLELYHDNSIEVKKLYVKVYDYKGTLIRNIKKSQIRDIPVGESMYSDARRYSVYLKYQTFPVKIKFYSKVEYSNSLKLRNWFPVSNWNVAVDEATLNFYNKNLFDVRIKSNKVVKSENSKEGKTVWELNNFKGLEYEEYAGSLYEEFPYVNIVPVKFQYYDTNGEYKSWKGYSQWMFKHLIRDKFSLDEPNAKQIKSLVENDSSDLDRAKTIYKYVQENFRYVSVQVGEGRIEPFDANETAQKKYGDCKALTIYTKAALNSVGIDAIYTEVHAGKTKRNLDSEFVTPISGNHVILCLPSIEKDTVWLECTSKNNPFGFLGNFTDDRRVLLIDKDGGSLVETKNLQKVEDKIEIKSRFDIDGDCNIKGKASVYYYGNESISNEYIISNYSKDDILVYLKHRFNNNSKLDSLEGEMISELNYVHSFNLEENNDIRRFNKQNFEFNPNLLIQDKIILRRNSNRIFDLKFDRAEVERIETEFILNENLEVEFLPNDVEIVNEFGSFVRKFKKEGNIISYKRIFRLNEGEYSKDKYNDLVKFLRNVKYMDDEDVSITIK